MTTSRHTYERRIFRPLPECVCVLEIGARSARIHGVWDCDALPFSVARGWARMAGRFVQERFGMRLAPWQDLRPERRFNFDTMSWHPIQKVVTS